MKFVFFTFSLSEVSINAPVSVFWVLFYVSGIKMKNVALAQKVFSYYLFTLLFLFIFYFFIHLFLIQL